MPGRIRFDWREAREIDWRERYSRDFVGYDLWMRIFEFEFGSPGWIDMALEALHRGRFSEADTSPARPCVFISHRQDDELQAVAAANVLINRDDDIDVWLDVEDPDLQRLAQHPDPSDPLVRILTALVIEMALINSSHVLAILTSNTKGSMWVPYEYGRIKQQRILDVKAAMLNLDEDKIEEPEYALLGPIFYATNALNNWP